MNIESILNNLTKEESDVMTVLRALKNPLQEPYIHLVVDECRNIHGQDNGDFELRVWKELGEWYDGFMHPAPFSEKIHDAIESLLWRGIIARRPSDKSYIYEPREKQLNLFPYKHNNSRQLELFPDNTAPKERQLHLFQL